MIAWLSMTVALAAEPLTLEQALARGLDVSEDLALFDADVASASGQVTSARAGFLPQVNGTVSYQHQFSSQFDSLFGAGGDGAVNPFAVKDTWQAALQVQQGLYGGGRAGATHEIATLSRDLADLSSASGRASVVLAVTSAYYDAVLADRLVAIATSTLDQSKTTLANTKLSTEVERASEFDALRASVDVENQQVALIQAERTRTRAHLVLANLLDLPLEEVVLTDDLERLQPVDAVVVSLLGPVAAPERLAVTQADTAIRISEASRTIVRAQGLPSAGLVGNFAMIGWSDTVLPPTEADAWNDAASLQLLVNVPIFNGGSVRGQLHTAAADVSAAETRAEQTRELVEADLRDATDALAAAEAQWEATSGTVEQAERAYTIANVRFTEGISTQVELADARLLLQRALANRAQAARDLQVARMRLSLLPLLPLF